MRKKNLSLFLTAVLLMGMFALVLNVPALKAEYPVNENTSMDPSGGLSAEAPSNGEQASAKSCRSYYDDAAQKISVTYYFSAPIIESSDACVTADGWVSVTMDGLPQRVETGLPVLPFMMAKILLPFGTEFERVSATSGNKIPLSGAYVVEYGQEAVPLSEIGLADAAGKSLPDERVYGSSEPFPGELYSDVSVQSKMGCKILLVNLFPVEYVPETGKLFYYDSIELEVEVASESLKASAFNGHLKQSEIVEGLVDNREVAETYLKADEPPIFEYVIITNEELSSTPGPNNFQALRDDKISRGISATIVTVEWIYATYDGTRPDGDEDDPTRIRNFIIDAYNNWGTMYVLLGGDGDGEDVGGESGDTIIPHRGFYAYLGEDTDDDVAADMYYSCLDGTFDYDGDGLYGEPNDGVDGGEVDLFAEVYVGRACVDSQAEVQNFVLKTLAYQDVAPTDANLRKVWMVGEDMDPWTGVSKWGGNFKDAIKEGSSAYGYTTVGFENSPYATRFDVSTLYDRDYAGNNWPKSEIVDVINDNAHLINNLGHSNILPPFMKMSISDVDSLLNDELYFIGYSQGCYCGSFDNRYIVGTHCIYDCVIEHMTTGAHGAVAYIANSRYGLSYPETTDGPSQHYDREFWDAVLGEDMLNIGIANQDSKEDNAGRINSDGDRYCYYEINLFGDPELMIVMPPADEHELTVKVDAPLHSWPGDSSMLHATVYNRGLNAESDIELFLTIDDTEVNSATIPELLTGESYTISYLWTPTAEATYDVTAYAPPVPDESNIENNVESVLVSVGPEILIVNDNDGSGWGSHKQTSLPEFESALMAADYDYSVWDEKVMGNPSVDFLAEFKLVIWTVGDYYNYAVDSTDMWALISYLTLGGNILLEGEDIGATNLDNSFMVNVAHAIYGVRDTSPDDGLTVTDTDHPVTQGLPTSFDWSEVPEFPDGVSPTYGGTEVIQYTDTDWTAVTVFGEVSDGSVVYYAFPLYCLEETEGQILTINSVDWLLQEELVEWSLTVTSAHDSPDPSVGIHSYVDGSEIIASVSSPVVDGETTYICTGWTGTGSVPPYGSEASVTFTITADSTITWNWASASAPEVPLAGWKADGSLTNAPYALSSTESELSLSVDASDTSSRVTIYTVAVPTLDLGDYDHIDVAVTGSANARILLRFFLDDGSGFDVVYWGDVATLDAVNFDLSAYAGRTLAAAYLALMSSDTLDPSIDITEIALVAEAPAPEVPLAGWVADESLTNAPYTLSSTASELSLDLDVADTSSRVTIYTLGVPAFDLGGYDHIDVAVTGTSNARILMRFFLNDGAGFDVVYWSDPITLNAISFDLSPYPGRTLTVAYIALMSSDGLDASIDITGIAFVE